MTILKKHFDKKGFMNTELKALKFGQFHQHKVISLLKTTKGGNNFNEKVAATSF